MTRYISILFICLILAHIGCTFSTSGKDIEVVNESDVLKVIEVIDGDTFWALDSASRKMKIRLIGVDAPESRKTAKKEIGYYGKEAKEYLKEMMAGKNISVRYDVDPFDQYNRTLAYVYLEDGTFVNYELVKNGYATVMTVPPNVNFADSFMTAQIEARANKRGLWGKISKP